MSLLEANLLTEENSMAAVVTFGSDALAEGTGLLDLVFNAFQTSGAQGSSNSNLGTITLTAQITPDLNVSVVFHGTNVTSGGTITDLSLTVNGANNFSASGLDISATDVNAAINETDLQQKFTDVLALFAGIDWTADLSALTVGSDVQGTGGDDNFTMTSASDLILLDGGNDTDNLGGGDDMIFAANGAYAVRPGVTNIDGGEGSDTFALDYRDGVNVVPFVTTGQTVDLQKGSFTYQDDLGVATFDFVSVENVRGSQFNDKLSGDAGANNLEGEEGNDKLTGRDGADTLVGDDGNDKLIGGAGADTLTGGAGADHFIYAAAADSNKQRDVITDFTHKTDKLDISALKLPKHDEFTLIGDHKFEHHAGDIRVVDFNSKGTANDFTMVSVDLDGNGKADLQIELQGLVHIDKNDFIF
jgi:Ca2+-binding RTX toxin-like protein